MGRLVVLKSPAIDENTEYVLDSTRDLDGPRRPERRAARQRRLRLGAARPGGAAARRRLDRGHRLDERHVRQRRPALPRAQARVRRPRARRRDRPAGSRHDCLGRSTGLSHPGRKRRRNEDAWVCQPPLFAVADGMGGARGGEIASQRRGDRARRERRRQRRGAGRRAHPGGEPPGLRPRAKRTADASGMGTTITVALVEDGVVAIRPRRRLARLPGPRPARSSS